MKNNGNVAIKDCGKVLTGKIGKFCTRSPYVTVISGIRKLSYQLCTLR